MDMSVRAIAALVAASFLGGLVAAASMGYGPLAAISFNVLPGGDNSTGTGLETSPFILDLGNLTAGESGYFNGTATLILNTSGAVEFDLENEDILKNVFSQFIVTVSVANQTFTLNLYGEDSYEVYLEAGEYTVFVEVEYTVKENPSAGYYENVVFLKAELDDNYGDYDEDNS